MPDHITGFYLYDVIVFLLEQDITLIKSSFMYYTFEQSLLNFTTTINKC